MVRMSDGGMGKPPNLRYVTGAIELTIGAAQPLTRKMGTDINWLWPFVTGAVDELIVRGKGETSFPDQPTSIAFSRLRTGEVVVDVDSKRVTAPFQDLVLVLASGAIEFFEWFQKWSPREYKEEMGRAKDILNQFASRS